MHQQKEIYLQVSYNTQKGLLLLWNFKDLLQQSTFFHHLFVVRHTDKQFLLQILSNYYKRMKLGDLFSVIYYDQTQKTVKKSSWLQKTQLITFQFSKLVKRMAENELTPQTKLALNDRAAKETPQGNQHFIVNFILQADFKHPPEYLQKQIIRGRRQGGFSYICTYFGHFKLTDVSFTRGINYINVYQEQLSTIIPFYYSYINNAAVKKAKITIECTNGQLAANNSLHWFNTDFNKLEKEFYGPSVSYEYDEIHFYEAEIFGENQIEIILHLHITLFSGQQLSSSKRVKLNFKQQKICEKSLILNKKENYLNHQGIWIATNPYNTLSVIRMIKSS